MDYLLGFGAHSGFWFCGMILGFGVNSRFGFFNTILGFVVQDLGVAGSGFSFFDTILGFGVLFLSHHIRVRGFGFLTPN